MLAVVISTQAWAVLIIVAYWVVLLLTRWLFVARPQQRATQALLGRTKAELAAIGSANAGAVVALEEARELRRERPAAFWQLFTWSGARDIEIWRLAHDAERYALVDRSPTWVRARLVRARSEVSELEPAKQAYWRTQLRRPWTAAEDEEARATLDGFLEELFDARGVQFANMATAQTRVTWIAGVGLLALLVLTQKGYDAVFLAGAAGAVLARMQFALLQRTRTSDFGLSWSTMALTPVAGALAAWAGLFFMALLQRLNIVDLKTLVGTITSADIRDPDAPLVGLAILFGFAERLINRVSDELQDGITAAHPAPAAAAEAAAGAESDAAAATAVATTTAPAPAAPAIDAEEVDESTAYGEQGKVADVTPDDVDRALAGPPLIEDEDAAEEPGEDQDQELAPVAQAAADGDGGPPVVVATALKPPQAKG